MALKLVKYNLLQNWTKLPNYRTALSFLLAELDKLAMSYHRERLNNAFNIQQLAWHLASIYLLLWYSSQKQDLVDRWYCCMCVWGLCCVVESFLEIRTKKNKNSSTRPSGLWKWQDWRLRMTIRKYNDTSSLTFVILLTPPRNLHVKVSQNARKILLIIWQHKETITTIDK